MEIRLSKLATELEGKDKDLILDVLGSLRKCSSRTLFDVAWNSYYKRLEEDRKRGEVCIRLPPAVEEFIDWKGDGEVDGALANVGLAKCKRISCPLCCYSRSFLRRNTAIEWAKNFAWQDYHAVSLTFTISHKLEDSSTPKRFKSKLDNLLTSLKSFSAFCRNLKQGNGYISSFPDSIGFISSLECTFGVNGLHPHFHTLFFTKCSEDVQKLREWFKKDRVRVWKQSGGSLLRMPDMNEDRSFQKVATPDKSGPEKIVAYITKGLFETISVDQKERTWSKTSKNIFHLQDHDLKYFCVFFEATKGVRFYRAGGICKSIPGIAKQVKAWEEGSSEDVVNRKLKTLVRITNKEKKLPPGWVSEFVQTHQKVLTQMAINLPSDAIKSLVEKKWHAFLSEKIQIQQDYLMRLQS